MAFLTLVAWFTIRIPAKKSDTARLHRLDYVGGLAILIAIVLFQVGLQSAGGGTPMPGNRPLLWSLFL